MSAPPRDPFAFAFEHDDVVWMSQNTNELVELPAVDAAVQEALKAGLHRMYPPAEGVEDLAQLVLDDLGLDADGWRVRFHPGSSEGHYVLHRALWGPGDEVVASDPSFMAIHQMVELAGASVNALPIYKEPFKLAPDQVQAALGSASSGLLLIDPLNPLGTGFDRDEVRAFAQMCADRGMWLMHDVAYRDFAEGHTLATEFAPEHTIINYTFSKSTGLAGLRLGATVAPPSVDAAMGKVDPTILGVNVLAQVAARAALRSKSQWLPPLLRSTRRNRDAIAKAVASVDGCFVPGHPSRANMLVIDISATGVSPDALQAKLLFDHHVFVRSGAYVSPRFGANFVRASFTVAEEDCDRFCEAFPLAMADLA